MMWDYVKTRADDHFALFTQPTISSLGETTFPSRFGLVSHFHLHLEFVAPLHSVRPLSSLGSRTMWICSNLLLLFLAVSAVAPSNTTVSIGQTRALCFSLHFSVR